MDVPLHFLRFLLRIFRLEDVSLGIGPRYDEKVQAQRQQRDDGCGENIRQHHPVETDSAGEDGDDFRVGRHSGCEEYDRYEHEQRAEHVHEIRDEIHVITEDDLLQRSLLGHEIIDFLTYVEDDHYSDYKENRDEEGQHKLLRDIYIQFFGKHSQLKSCHYPFNRNVFPCLEVSCEDMGARCFTRSR